MANIHSTVTDLPLSCKSASDRMSRYLEKEDAFAVLTDDCCRKITELEQYLSKHTGDNVALVAYRI